MQLSIMLNASTISGFNLTPEEIRIDSRIPPESPKHWRNTDVPTLQVIVFVLKPIGIRGIPTLRIANASVVW